MENHIDLALVNEFYSNLYDPKDHSPRQCKVRGKTINFDATTLNTFLETLVVLEPGERYPAYSRYCHTYPDHQAIAAKLCLRGRGFVLNAEGAPWKHFRKDKLDYTSPDLECPFPTPTLLPPLTPLILIRTEQGWFMDW